MNLPKVKIHLKLSTVLWLVFLIAVLLEIFVLYRYLYDGNFRPDSAPLAETSASTVRIDLPSANAAGQWVENKQDYQSPDYNLSGSGRANPFAEY